MEKELKANAQKVGEETQYEIRKAIIRMLKKGMKGREIAKILDVSEGHVSNVKKAYAENGIEGIKPKHQGRKTGEKRILSPQQEKEIMDIIGRVEHCIENDDVVGIWSMFKVLKTNLLNWLDRDIEKMRENCCCVRSEPLCRSRRSICASTRTIPLLSVSCSKTEGISTTRMIQGITCGSPNSRRS